MPTSILGLPVHTVAGMHELAASGALDGHMVAVAGFWTQEALPCAFMPHAPAVLGFCNGGRFADSPGELQTGSGGTAPIAVPETVGGNLLWQQAGPAAGSPARVVLIVHAADSRSLQCALPDRGTCVLNLVIDRVAWINDEQVATDQPDSTEAPAGLHLTLDEVVGTGVQVGETLVLADPILATQLNEVDPRFVGKASGLVWYLRVMSGTPDADGIVTGRDVLVDDATGAVVTSLPLAVDAAYNPARVVLDSSGWNGAVGSPAFAISSGNNVVAANGLGGSTVPLALAAGDYTVQATINTPQANPVAGPTCDLPLTVAAGDDVSFYADFAGSGDCTWKSGTLFP